MLVDVSPFPLACHLSVCLGPPQLPWVFAVLDMRCSEVPGVGSCQRVHPTDCHHASVPAGVGVVMGDL